MRRGVRHPFSDMWRVRTSVLLYRVQIPIAVRDLSCADSKAMNSGLRTNREQANHVPAELSFCNKREKQRVEKCKTRTHEYTL